MNTITKQITAVIDVLIVVDAILSDRFVTAATNRPCYNMPRLSVWNVGDIYLSY